MSELLPIAVRLMFPGATPGVDYSIRDDSDGSGPRISFWNVAGKTKPTTAQLNSAKEIAAQPNLQGRYIVLDGNVARFATLEESSIAAPTLRQGLIFLFRKIPVQIDRVKQIPNFASLKTYFDSYGENLEKNSAIKNDVWTYIANSLDNDSNQELKDIRDAMLALPQWNY